MRFENKVVIVTGGAKGIGRCITQAFLNEGASAAVIDNDEKAGQRLAQRFGGRLLFFKGDVGQKEALSQFADKVLSAYGKVDCLINNACITRKGLVSGCSYEDFDYVLRVGVTAPYYLSLLLRDQFAQGAAIVNISSTRAVMSQPDTESYTAAKGAISALTHALCLSLAGKVRVNAVSPGWIDTSACHDDEGAAQAHTEADLRQHPSGRIGQPDDIANMVLYLCSAAAGFINGENITIDGGMTRRMIYHGDDGWQFGQEGLIHP